MNAPPVLSAPPRRRGWLIFAVIFALLLLALPGALVLGVASCFRLGSDASALRRSVLTGSEENWDRQVEFSLGWIPLALVRNGLRFAPLEPEARLAVSAVRGVEVAVYQRKGSRPSGDREALLMAAEKAMNSRGWERIVRVVHEDELVAIYVPETLRATDRLRVCLVVMNEQELVVASVSGDVAPLLKLIEDRPELKHWTARR